MPVSSSCTLQGGLLAHSAGIPPEGGFSAISSKPDRRSPLLETSQQIPPAPGYLRTKSRLQQVIGFPYYPVGHNHYFSTKFCISALEGRGLFQVCSFLGYFASSLEVVASPYICYSSNIAFLPLRLISYSQLILFIKLSLFRLLCGF